MWKNKMFTVYFGGGHDTGMDKRCSLFHTNVSLHLLLGPVSCGMSCHVDVASWEANLAWKSNSGNVAKLKHKVVWNVCKQL